MDVVGQDQVEPARIGATRRQRLGPAIEPDGLVIERGQHLLAQQHGGAFVVDQQDGLAAPARGRRLGRSDAGRGGVRAREVDLKGAAPTGLALDVDGPAVVGHDAVDRGQPGQNEEALMARTERVARVLGESPQLVFGPPIGEVLRPSRQGTGVRGRAGGLGERVD
jgi:hypothetical protein